MDADVKDAAGTRQEPAKEGSASGGLLPVIDGALKLGGFLYVLGFAVIMVHTSSLHVPVVEALQFQNILAGWPIGLAIWLAFRLWPWARRAVRPEAVSTNGLLILAGGLLLSAIIVRVELVVFVSGLSIYANILLFSAIFFLANVGFLYVAYAQHGERVKPLFRATCVYSLVAFLVLAYAILAYPKMSQSIGGGRPQQVGLYLDSAELAGVLGASTGSDSKVAASGPLYLYYRTGGYLLVSEEQNSERPLIEVPANHVRAIVWLESRSKQHLW